MTSPRQNKNRKLKANTNSYFYQKEFYWIHAASHFGKHPFNSISHTISTSIPCYQISDLPTLPNKNNVSLEQQLKQQQLLINKLTNRINALESHIQLLEGKVTIQETVNNLLEQKADDLEAYSRRTMRNCIRNLET